MKIKDNYSKIDFHLNFYVTMILNSNCSSIKSGVRHMTFFAKKFVGHTFRTNYFILRCTLILVLLHKIIDQWKFKTSDIVNRYQTLELQDFRVERNSFFRSHEIYITFLGSNKNFSAEKSHLFTNKSRKSLEYMITILNTIYSIYMNFMAYSLEHFGRWEPCHQSLLQQPHIHWPPFQNHLP